MTSLHSRVVVMCLALAAGAGGCATQNSPFGSASEIDRAFASSTATWDLNRDGEVTCEEWRQYASGLFADADANKDGALSRQEFAAMARVDRLFEIANFDYFDADGDGKVTLAEIIDKPNPAFRLLDKNGDCVIGRDERLGERSPGTSGQGKGKRQRGPGGGSPGL
jgi:EF hand